MPCRAPTELRVKRRGQRLPTPAAPAGLDTVSLDEVEAGEEKVAEPAVDDIEVEEDADDGADHPFLEEEEEDEDDDVSNLIDGDIAPDEDT